ncbi:MAG: gliding motility-associated C-terminal domain-containing protein, partial [Chitinophagales bacterium]|nr:gliding motility-associated C-terminal domain-containing protein [Chitinophagales bacterium]
IKAITNPAGTQPVSNTIAYKLVCNDVSAISTTTSICSGESAIVNISSTDPNATLSWTVSGGSGITGASAGTGNSINQVLTYNGNTKDSVTYTAISNDAGCTKTQTVKVVVNKCSTDPCDNWLYLADTPSGIGCGDLDIVGNKVTVECMFNKLPPVTSPHLVSKHQVATAVNYAIGPLNAEITTTNNGYVLLNAPCPPDAEKTYHVAMVYDGSTFKYYRNGYLVASTPCSGNLINNNIVTTIGQINQATGPDYEQFKGYMNEVRIWNVARTQQEIRANMSGTLPNPTTQTGLKGYYVFDNLLNKQGDAAYNGTIIGTAQINKTNPQCSFIPDSCGIAACNPTITGNLPFCQGDSITLDAGSGFSSYSWNTGAAFQTIKVRTGGKYVVNVTGQNNCTGSDSVQVVVNSIPQVSISGNSTFCAQSQTRLTANADADSVRWNTNETSGTISVSQAQTYSVTVYKNGCSNSASLQVSQVNPPTAFSLGNDTSFCGDFSKVLSTGNQQTQWNTDITAAQITVTQAGTYIATISNDCGSVSDTIVIEKNELPIVDLGNDTAFCEGELLLSAPSELRSYVWSTGAQSSSITVTAAGTYSVSVTDGNGCSGSDAIVISSNCANDLWIPNAFTPNRDGTNDVFYVRGNPQNTTIEKFLIYNRWGNKVFEATNILPDDITKGWDGTFKGEPAQFEAYGYEVVARFNNGSKKTLKGNVTLLK